MDGVFKHLISSFLFWERGRYSQNVLRTFYGFSYHWGDTALSIMTLSIMTLSIKTFSVMTISIIIFIIMTLSISTLYY
jgi:hypothetical protein